MVNLYLSNSLSELEQYFVGDPITQANQAISDKLQKSLEFAFGQTPTDAVGNLSVTSTSLQYTLAPGSVAPAGVNFDDAANVGRVVSLDCDCKVTGTGIMAAKKQSLKGLALEPVSTHPHTTGGTLEIEFAMKYS